MSSSSALEHITPVAGSPLSEPIDRVYPRVLLVEDNDDHQRLFHGMLRNKGYRVSVADNGQTGVESVLDAHRKQQPFDLILMDIRMPVLDGLAAVRHLRSAGVTSPILALSAGAMIPEQQECLDAGCNEFIAKPVDRRVLLRRVSAHLNRVQSL